MNNSTAIVATENAGRYLQQLCKHWAHRFPVVSTAEHASIDFGEGRRVELTAAAAELTVRAVVTDGKPEIVSRVVEDHLRRFGFREELVFDWRPGE